MPLAATFLRPLPPGPVPELPEVETIRRGLEQRLVGRRIVAVEAGPNRLRKPSPLPWSALRGLRVHAVRRHAKVLFWDLDGGHQAVGHLGMTGKFLCTESQEPLRPHTHLRLRLDDGQELRYIDPRRFGWFKLHAPGDPPDDVLHYGPDALDPGLTPERLAAMMARSRAPLKAFLMDQTKIAGLGNIYVCEALWRARLSPRRLACNVAAARVPELLGHIRGVLEASLAQGGTSFNDYVDSIGRPGQFLVQAAVFQNVHRPCPRCARPVQRIVQGGRSTFLCGRCQR